MEGLLAGVAVEIVSIFLGIKQVVLAELGEEGASTARMFQVTNGDVRRV